MLILTRKCGQAFQIGDDVRITVTEVSGDKVRIGIEAPREMCVLREELVQTRDLNRAAVSAVNTGALRAMAKSLHFGGAKQAEQKPE